MKLLILLSIFEVSFALHRDHAYKVCKNRRSRQLCGADGLTYDNECLRRHNNVEKAYEGPCRHCEGCDGEIKNVCGSNGFELETFVNACWADCKGFYVVKEKECEHKDQEKSECGDYIHRVCGVNGNTYRNACFAKQ